MKEEDFAKYELFKDIGADDINTFGKPKRKISLGPVIFLIFIAGTFAIIYYMFFITYDISVTCKTQVGDLSIPSKYCKATFYDKNGKQVYPPLPRGEYKVRVSVPGFSPSEKRIRVPEDTSVMFSLSGFGIRRVESEVGGDELAIYPKVRSNVSFILLNTGDADIQVSVSVEGESALKISYPHVILLNSGEEKKLNITFFCESEYSICKKGMERAKDDSFVSEYTVVFTVNDEVKIEKKIKVKLLKDIRLRWSVVSGSSSPTLYENESKIIVLSLKNNGEREVKNIKITYEEPVCPVVQDITPSSIDSLLPDGEELIRVTLKAPEIMEEEECVVNINASVDMYSESETLKVRVRNRS